MKPVTTKNCWINGVFYNKGDEVKGLERKEQVIKLIELGFVEPLSDYDIENFNKKQVKGRNKKKEDK